MGNAAQFSPGRKILHAAYLNILKADVLWGAQRSSALRFVIAEVRQTLNAQRVGLWRYNDSRDQLHCQMLCTATGCAIESDLIIQAADHPAYFTAIEAERVLAADNARHHAATESFTETYLKPLGIGAILDVTVIEGGLTTGILCIEHGSGTRHWTPAEENFAIAVADLISQVLIFNALAESREKYQKVFDSSTDGMLIMLDYRVVDCNEATFTMFGCNRDEYFRHSPVRFWTEYQSSGETSRAAAERILAQAELGVSRRFEWLHRRLDGTEFPSEVDLTPIDINGVVHYLVCVRDISERKAAETHIQELLNIQQAVVNCANYSIIATDLDGTITSFNRAAEQLLGYQATEMLQQATPVQFHDTAELNWRAIELTDELHSAVAPGFAALTAKAKAGLPDEREWTYLHKTGARIPVLLSVTPLKRDEQQLNGFLFIASDVSLRKRAAEALLQSQRDMEHRANHDDLTDLPNRTRLHDQTQSAICSAQGKQRKLALMLLDLDRFKEVNDTLGHAFGDELIKHIGERLNAFLDSKGAHLYRLGGDEFAIMMPDIHDMRLVDKLVEGVHKTLREAITIRDIHMEVTGSIGIAVYPDHGEDSHSLLRCADVAMYKAKTASTNTIVYQPQADSHSPRRLTMMSELGYAIRNNQLALHYQPRIAIAEQKCIGCEALVRWQHPKLGMIPPFEFIPLAEVSDQIQSLAYWVLRTALLQARQWLADGIDMVVSVNLSTRNLMDVTIPDQIEHLLQETGVSAKYLEIEITESTLIDDPDRALQVIDRIHKLGVCFAIDDFGTGYSSLSYLKRLPISTLKIDRSFIKDMLTDEQDAVIVRSTLGLAHSFGLAVVAEGVEDRETLIVLRELACEQVQGYFFSKPLPSVEFEQWFRNFH